MTAVYLLSGPMGAGKSTVARLLAGRFERGVHLEGDLFRRSIVSGRVEMTPDASPDALEQLRLRYRLAAVVADGYCEAGFTVALEDVVAGPLLAEYRATIRSRPCHVVVLMPSLHALAERAASRAQTGHSRWTLEQLYDAFSSSTPRVGVWLDTSAQTPEQTVDEILAAAPPAREPVVVAEYDPEWPRRFEQVAEPVRQALGELAVTVEHIGSTAVPGLPAKPVIDVDVVVRSAEHLPAAIERLRNLGYVYQGDKGIPGREAFMWPEGTPRHHLYVVVAGSKPHVDHVRFRDLLRAHPELAREYAQLKRELAERHRTERERYTLGKAAFVERTLAGVRVD